MKLSYTVNYCSVVCSRSSHAHRNILPAPTDAVTTSKFKSKAVFDEIEKRLKEVYLPVGLS